jgi:hypothetical protein
MMRGSWTGLLTLPGGDEGLVEPTQGKAKRWVEGQGWVELDE